MIHIGLDFIRAYNPSEQLVMLHLLLHADENGNVDFCERSISRATEVSYKICRNIHQRFKSEGIIKGAPKGALQGALGEAVTICDFDSYSVLTKIRAQVVGALQGALKEVEITKDKEKVFPHTPLQIDIENNKDEEDIKEEESNVSKKKKFVYPQEYENDFNLYGRKGSKKNGYNRWKDLTEDEKTKMRKHIPYYLQSNDRQYLKDFEGYINQRQFESPVYKGSELLFNPVQLESPSVYSPLTDGILQWWDDKEKCLHFNGYIDMLDDGYTADNRPDGAKVKWQMYSWIWSATNKEWIKQQ